jgi:hypothetical protein
MFLPASVSFTSSLTFPAPTFDGVESQHSAMGAQQVRIMGVSRQAECMTHLKTRWFLQP